MDIIREESKNKREEKTLGGDGHPHAAEFIKSEIEVKPMTKIEQIINGLSIIQSYEPDAKTGADYEFIYAGSVKGFSEEDYAMMLHLDWIVDEWGEGWAHYV